MIRFSKIEGSKKYLCLHLIVTIYASFAVAAVKRGEKKIEVSRFFKISRNTLDLWLKKEIETGDVKASRPVGVGTRPKIQELEKFREFVSKNSDKTQKQMAQLWGDEATQQNISYACRKLGITRKKKLMDTGKEMKKKDENFFKN